MVKRLPLIKTVVAALTLAAAGCVCGKPHEVSLSAADRDAVALEVRKELEAQKPQLAELLEEFENRKQAVVASVEVVNSGLLAWKMGASTSAEVSATIASARKLVGDLANTKGAIKSIRTAPAEMKVQLAAVVKAFSDTLKHVEEELARRRK
jgi:hypothetical protein